MLFSLIYPHYFSLFLSIDNYSLLGPQVASILQKNTGFEVPVFGFVEGGKNPQSVDMTGVSLPTRSDSLDWKGIPAGQITRRVLDRVQPGSIVLFHNAAEHTPEALPAILESLLNDGYRIVPVSQILLEGDCFIDSTGRQCRH